MSDLALLAALSRNGIVESTHYGHAVICDTSGQIVEAWGNPEQIVFPRSSCKMLQALPLIESGAAQRFGLTTEQLALSCASHNGAAIHTDRVQAWLSDLGLSDDDLRCGSHTPRDKDARLSLLHSDQPPCQYHNNCSGKHAGFLTLTRHLGADPDYHLPDHAVQKACLEAFEALTDVTSPGYGIDGCSAPNYATTMHGMARAMAYFAGAERSDTRSTAARSLFEAMIAHPDLVAGEGRACTELMRACSEPVALKTGAEAFFVAILPTRGLGIALKVADGGTRGAECAIAALLVRLGVLDPNHPATLKRMNTDEKNWNGMSVATMRPAAGLLG